MLTRKNAQYHGPMTKFFLFLLLFIGIQGIANADSKTWKEDTDGDGFPETKFYDFDGDGKPDSASVDKNRDGKEDEYWVDADADGDWDRVWFDTDGDGEWDKGWHDLDGDGDFEIEWIDANGNGKVDPGETHRLEPEVPVQGPRPIAELASLELIENPTIIREAEIALPLPATQVSIFDRIHLPWMILSFVLALIVIVLFVRKGSRS